MMRPLRFSWKKVQSLIAFCLWFARSVKTNVECLKSVNYLQFASKNTRGKMGRITAHKIYDSFAIENYVWIRTYDLILLYSKTI